MNDFSQELLMIHKNGSSKTNLQKQLVDYFPHCCPVCGKQHMVKAIRHQLAYGKAYTCSLDCETIRRKNWWHFSVKPTVKS